MTVVLEEIRLITWEGNSRNPKLGPRREIVRFSFSHPAPISVRVFDIDELLALCFVTKSRKWFFPQWIPA